VTELDIVDDQDYADDTEKGSLVDGVTDALAALGVTVELGDVSVKDAAVLVYPNRDKVQALPLPAKPTGLQTTTPDDLTSGSADADNTMLFVGVGGVAIAVGVVVVIAVVVVMKSRKNTSVADVAASQEPQAAPSEEPPAEEPPAEEPAA
jgi:hypothetical protein